MNLQLESLTVQAFRGIRGEKQFEFGGKNTIIFGPNGSGKSTILQSIEFLLTGQISALKGSGTGGIRTKEHVPNQYADPDETAVRATFRTENGKSFRAVREFSNRSRLQTGDRPAAFQELVTAAEQGLIHLSRDELLELVIATPGTRKDQIYHLMDTEGLDGRRKQLKRLARQARNEASDRNTRYQEYLQQLRQVGGDTVVTRIDEELELRPDSLLSAVNERRERLGGTRIEALDVVDSFQDGLTSPVKQASNPLQRDTVQQQLTTIEAWANEEAESTAATLADLREELRALHADKDALNLLAEQGLVEQGLDIIDNSTTACPLCKKPWEATELETYLEDRAERLTRIDERIDRINELASYARNEIESIRVTTDRVVDVLRDADLNVDIAPLANYRDAIEAVIEELSGGLTDDPQAVNFEALKLPTASRRNAEATVSSLQESAAALPDQSTIETTWSQLQTLDEAYGGAERASVEKQQYDRAKTEFERAHERFIESRDDILGETFEMISDRFAAFYEAVNPDESAFDPKISQTNTGIDFAVDFYDTGEHPPHAMHSEGHQDLMGVCLFLALATELSPLDRLPVLLDDVVMSVDEGHRSQFATVLRDELSEHFQLIVTTHDARWAKQLVDSGVSHKEDVVQFTDWEPIQGPTITSGLD